MTRYSLAKYVSIFCVAFTAGTFGLIAAFGLPTSHLHNPYSNCIDGFVKHTAMPCDIPSVMETRTEIATATTTIPVITQPDPYQVYRDCITQNQNNFDDNLHLQIYCREYSGV